MEENRDRREKREENRDRREKREEGNKEAEEHCSCLHPPREQRGTAGEETEKEERRTNRRGGSRIKRKGE